VRRHRRSFVNAFAAALRRSDRKTPLRPIFQLVALRDVDRFVVWFPGLDEVVSHRKVSSVRCAAPVKRARPIGVSGAA
jgi:hypothetical protein